MLSRVTLAAVTVFWLVMNVLLWRSEFGGRNHLGSSLPVSVVWQKMLTAPDPSGLEILHHGTRVGFCRWADPVGQSASSRLMATEGAPEPAPEEPANYRIDVDGNVTLGDKLNHLGFDVEAVFSTNQVWQDLRLRLTMRPDILEVRSRAAEEAIHVQLNGPDGRTERTIQFAELQNPEALMRELEMPFPLPLAMLGGIGVSPGRGKPDQYSLGLNWEAHNDWVTIGHTAVKAYRLETRLLERYRIVVMVSKVGEILRVELPDDWLLVNEQLTSL